MKSMYDRTTLLLPDISSDGIRETYFGKQAGPEHIIKGLKCIVFIPYALR